MKIFQQMNASNKEVSTPLSSMSFQRKSKHFNKNILVINIYPMHALVKIQKILNGTIILVSPKPRKAMFLYFSIRYKIWKTKYIREVTKCIPLGYYCFHLKI